MLLSYSSGCSPGGTTRNYNSYGSKVKFSCGSDLELDVTGSILCDPQTSGGLLIAVEAGDAEEQLIEILKEMSIVDPCPIGGLREIDGESNGFIVVDRKTV